MTAFFPVGTSGEGSATSAASASAPLPDTLAADAVPLIINDKSVSSANRRMGTPGPDHDLALPGLLRRGELRRIDFGVQQILQSHHVNLHQDTDAAST